METSLTFSRGPLRASALALALGGTATMLAADPTPPALIPQPTKVAVTRGCFQLTSQTRWTARSPGVQAEGRRLAAALRQATGLPLPAASKSPVQRGLALELDTDLASRLGTEGYCLSVTPEGVRISAAGEAGLFYGGITFRQLLPPRAFGASPPSRSPEGGWVAPCVEIEDSPRYGWRGLLLDPARHFLPAADLRGIVDAMAVHKLNRLQLHLTDDQGWRLEIKRHPRLTAIGSRRKESPQRGRRDSGDGTPYGPFFYTQAEMRKLVAYADERHVMIVPEIEMPGHFLAALATYPQLSCRGGPFEVRTRWGVEPDILCPGNEESFRFVEEVLGEVIDLFPSPFIHIGGDEAPRERWKQCPKCQARIKAEGLKNEAQLQTYFNRRVESFLVSRGRRLVGWDEILEGGLTPGATVMSWRGMEGGIAAAEAGHDVIMSPTSHCYLDYAQAKGAGEPEAIGGYIPLPAVYAFQPTPPTLAPPRQHHILGAQGNVWGEFIWTVSEAEYFAFPRASALAEVVWSPASGRDFDDFQRRLGPHLQRLDALRVNYRPLSSSEGQ